MLACWVGGTGNLLFFISRDSKTVYGQWRRSVPERLNTSLCRLQPQVVLVPNYIVENTRPSSILKKRKQYSHVKFNSLQMLDAKIID